ncbi:MAG: pseudouridine synthase, partial [Myxococcales bacterium]
MKKLVLDVPKSDEGERLDRFIAERGRISRGEARRVLERGGVWIDQQRVKIASRPVFPGQQITVVLEEAGRATPEAFALSQERVLFEDDAVIAVDKPAGIAAQATLGSDAGNLLSAASAWAGVELGIVHRLDLETSGVTVFGRTRAATSALAAAFRDGKAKKTYLALVAGALPDSGTIDRAIRGDPARKGSYTTGDEGAPSVTHFRVLARKGPVALV